MNFLSREDISDKLTSFSEMVNEQATVLNLYPIFKKATSSSQEPTPGYLYDILIEFSFKSNKNSLLLGDYMNKRLQRHSVHGILKTLKCINHLVEKGSRSFRKYLRMNDEHVKNAPSFGSQNNTFNGTALLEEIKTLVTKILQELFSQSNIDRDSSSESEIVPSFKQSLPGMGQSNKHVKEVQKYEGFGSSPIDRSGVTDSIRNVLDQLIHAPDPKQELLEACLKGHTGQYQAAKVSLPEQTSANNQDEKKIHQPKQFIPGRAGGGWEDDDSDDDFMEFGGLCLDPVDDEAVGHIAATSEFDAIRQFCCGDAKTVNLDQLGALMDKLALGERMNILYAMKHILETETGESVFKLLLVLEKIQETALIPATVVLNVLRTNLEVLKNDENAKVAIKTAKNLAILEFFKDYKKS